MTDYLFLTTSRADFGILEKLISIFSKKNVSYGIIVSGSHIGSQFASKELKRYLKKFKVLKFININTGKKNMFFEIKKIYAIFPQLLKKINPKAVIVLGDRYEMHAFSEIAYLSRIPIIHFHGGETTEGSFDDGLRHSISIFSSLHFVTDDTYKRKLICLGCNPSSIFNFGSLSVNWIIDDFLKDIPKQKGIIERKNVIVIFHPETIGTFHFNIKTIVFLIKKYFVNKEVFLFLPNNDPGRDSIEAGINQINNCTVISNVLHRDYLKILADACLIIGNSSSALIEAPALKVPTINVGNRQKGRIKAVNVLDANFNNIEEVIKKVITNEFIKTVESMEIPFYKKNGNTEIFKTIISWNFTKH